MLCGVSSRRKRNLRKSWVLEDIFQWKVTDKKKGERNTCF